MNIPIHCKYDELVDPLSLIPNPKNTNIHSPKQIAILKKIIQYNGWRENIKVSRRSGFISTGHLRAIVGIELGMEKVPVEYQDFENEAQEFAHLNADNEIARLAEFDREGFLEALEEMELLDMDMELFGLPEMKLEEPQKEDEKDLPIDEEKYLIVIECKDELEQSDLFDEFQTREISCKLMS